MKQRTRKNPNTYEPTKRNKRGEAKRLQTFDELPTPEIFKRLYVKHERGIWQSIALLTLIALITTIAL